MQELEFDIDVSGEDIFKNNYTICIASKDGIIKGFKITSPLINIINSRHGQGLYRYEKSKKGRSLLKIRLYSIIIYYLFKSLNLKNKNISLNICRDFYGKEQDIKSNLRYFLEDLLYLRIDRFNLFTLGKDSNAHRYAYLMRKDTKNKLDTYVKINIENIERFIKK